MWGRSGSRPGMRPQLRSGSAVFTTRSWTDADGDAGFPKEVEGVPVAEQIRTRRDTRGALVRARGRALRGDRPAPRARRCRSSFSATPAGGLSAEDDAAARAWWQEVIGALAR